MTAGQVESSGQGTGGLRSRSFIALLVTQGFGSLNDNVFRWFCVLQGMKVESMKASTMSLGLICFTIPYLLLASHSAFVADRFSKRKTIVACKIAEVIIMALAVGAMALGGVDEMLGIYLVFAAVFLMGAQSAMFGPAKFGSIPEIVRSEKISEANGLMQMVTTAASALGMFAGFVVSSMADLSPGDPTFVGLMWPAGSLISIAALGMVASLFIEPLTPADTELRPPNPFTETVANLRLLVEGRPLFRAALGEAFFWFLASLATSAITLMGAEVLGLDQIKTGLLAIALVIGVGTGSVLAGMMSGGKVELGLVPLGASVVLLGALSLYWVTGDVDPTNPATQTAAVWPAAFSLSLLGLGAGFFIVPLVAFLQDRSERKTRGRILAAANFISFSMMIVSAVVFYVVTEGGLNWTAPTIFLATGIGTIPVLLYVLWLLPQASIRMFIWILSRVIYRVKVFGRENIPDQGGALIVANHVTYMDGFLLLTSSSRPIRFVAHADHINRFGIARLSQLMGVIPIRSTDGPKAIVASLREARAAVENGELVCIFPEGQLTPSGHVEQFHRGMMKIVDGLNAPIVPIFLDELWGSIFSHKGGRIIWKLPRRWPYPVAIHVGEPLACPDTVEEVREAVLQLGGQSPETSTNDAETVDTQEQPHDNTQAESPTATDHADGETGPGNAEEQT
ncbi:MAG: MFS transporter [Planctomycetota bacterium]|nr:MFS transporter [Planctomycetota bacterium]